MLSEASSSGVAECSTGGAPPGPSGPRATRSIAASVCLAWRNTQALPAVVLGRMAILLAIPRELRRLAVAHHEAGHAVFAWRYGVQLRDPGVLLHPDLDRLLDAEGEEGQQLGTAHFDSQVWPGERNRILSQGSSSQLHESELRSLEWRADIDAACCLSGPLAERRFLRLRGYPPQRNLLPGGEADYVGAERSLQEASGDASVSFALYLVYQSNRRALSHPRTWSAVQALAVELDKQGQIGPDEAEEIITAAKPPRARRPRFCTFLG